MATQNYTVTILAVFAGTTPNTLPAGTANSPYSQNLTSTGGVAPITYSFVAGTPVPPGLSITPSGPTTGVLSGTPTSAGNYSFPIQAVDSSVPPQSYTEQLALTIRPQPPTGLSGTPNNGVPSVSLSWTGSLTNGVTSYNVYRSLTSGTGYSLVGSSSTASYLDESVVFTTYYYVVTAVANGAESVYSNEAPVTLTPQP